METHITRLNATFSVIKRQVLPTGLLLFLIISFGSCIKPDYFPCVSGTGETVEEVRTGSQFSGIDLMLHAQVFVTHGDNHSVTIVAPQNLLPHITTRYVGNTLMIANDRCIRNRINEIQVFVSMPEIQSLSIAGSGTITMEDVWETNNLSLNVSGSGKITGFFEAVNINTRISGSGDVNLTGSATNHHIIISGSGKVNGYSLHCKAVDVRISGSGHAYVYANESIYAKISGSGNIFYKGTPSVNASISGTGKIIRK